MIYYVTTTGNTFTASDTVTATSAGTTYIVVGNWTAGPPDAPPAGVWEPRRPAPSGGPARTAVDG